MPRPSNPWYCKSRGWWYTRINGKRIGLAKGPKTSTQKAAYAEFRRIFGDIDTPPKNTLRVDALCYEFMVRALHGLDISTAEWYARWLDPFVEAYGLKMPYEVRPIEVTKWLDSHKWGDTSRKSAVTAVKRVFRWAKQQGLIDENTLADMPRPPAKRWPHTIAAGKSREIIDAVEKGDPFRYLLEALWGTGCRPGELMRLQAGNVDLTEGKLTVRNKTRRKTGEPTRTVWLSPEMVALFRQLLRKRREGHVFVNNRGNPWTRHAVIHRFKRLRKNKGFGPECTAKVFRVDFITSALERGVPIATVAELVGHTSTNMIMQVYSRLGERKEHLKASMAAVRAEANPDPCAGKVLQRESPNADVASPPDVAKPRAAGRPSDSARSTAPKRKSR